MIKKLYKKEPDGFIAKYFAIDVEKINLYIHRTKFIGAAHDSYLNYNVVFGKKKMQTIYI